MEADDYAAGGEHAAGGLVGKKGGGLEPFPKMPGVVYASDTKRATVTTLQRVARPPLIILVPMLLSALYGWVVFATTFRAPGVFGPNYDTLGTDYMVFMAASRWPCSAIGACCSILTWLFDSCRFSVSPLCHQWLRRTAGNCPADRSGVAGDVGA